MLRGSFRLVPAGGPGIVLVVDFGKNVLRADVQLVFADGGDGMSAPEVVDTEAGVGCGLVTDRAVDHTEGD